MHAKMGKFVMISDDYHNIEPQLLLLTIIVDSKNWTMLISIKENITVNRRNRLIAYLYCRMTNRFIKNYSKSFLVNAT